MLKSQSNLNNSYDEIKWLTHDGRLLHFSEMTDNHLCNIFKHMEVYSSIYPENLRKYVLGIIVDRGIAQLLFVDTSVFCLNNVWKTYDWNLHKVIDICPNSCIGD